MSVAAGMARMERARKDLLTDWQRTRQSWRDTMADRLEKDVIEPADTDLRQTIEAMETLAGLLAEARRDCE